MPAPMRLRRCSSLLAAALALCALLAACGGSPMATGTATVKSTARCTPSAASFATYKSPDGVYTITYPSDWSSAPEDGSEGGVAVKHGVSFVSPERVCNFQVQPLNASVAAGDYGVFVQSLAGALGASDYTPGKADPVVTSSVTIGAHTWTELDGTMTLGGTTYAIKQFGTPHAGATVLVVTIAPAVSMPAMFSADFKPMLASLTFLK